MFLHVPKNRFFGMEEVGVIGLRVPMATPERAVLDALDRPQLAGGIGEVSRIIRKAARKLSWGRLLEYLGKWGRSSIVQRLGFFLDLHKVTLNRKTRSALSALVSPHNKIHLGSRGRWGSSGRLSKAWNIIENVPRGTLIEKTARGRRK